MKLPDIWRSTPKDQPSLLHLAINIARIAEWAEKERVPLQQAIMKNLEQLKTMMQLQFHHDIPILTLCLPQMGQAASPLLTEFFQALAVSEEVHKNQTRIFIIGRWYELEEGLIEAIKQAMSRTAEYDRYFLNFCLNYDGQEEILSAVRLIARKVFAEKLDVEEIDDTEIKDNLYSSYFTPPDCIIETDTTYSGMLLWDAPRSSIHYLDQYWLDADRKDIEEVLEQFQRRTGKRVTK